MRIGIAVQRLFKPRKHGTDIAALELIRALQVIDNENEYYIFVQPDDDSNCLKETRNFHIIEISSFNSFIWEQIMLPNYAHKYKLDILHCTNKTAPLTLSMPLILTLHDIKLREQSKVKKSAFSFLKYTDLYEKWLLPKIVKNCQKIITISENQKDTIVRKFGVEDNAVVIVNNGVSRRFGIRPSKEFVEEIRIRLGLLDDYFLFFGSEDPDKNVVNTIHAFIDFAERNPKLKLVVTDLEESYLEKILYGINKIEFFDRLVLTGFVDDNTLLALYAEAKVFLYPSLKENLGLPILEAMAFGVPVVTSDIFEIASDATFMVNPSSVAEITQGMTLAYSNEILRNEKINLGYGKPSLFSWLKTATKMLSIYQSNT